MGHGMGIAFCSISIAKLTKDFGVKKIIRVGSCGAVSDGIKLRDVISMGTYYRFKSKPSTLLKIATLQRLLASDKTRKKQAKARGIDVKVGNFCRFILHAKSRHVPTKWIS